MEIKYTMKINELRSLIQEAIKAEQKIAPKITPEILRKLIREEIEAVMQEEDTVDEIFGFGSPATDAELDAWLNAPKRRSIKDYLVKLGDEKYQKWRTFVKDKYKSNIKNDEAIMNIRWDDQSGGWKS